jgi:hypothetical protein
MVVVHSEVHYQVCHLALQLPDDPKKFEDLPAETSDRGGI